MNKTLIIILNLCIIAVILVVLLIAVYPFIRFNNMDISTLNIWIVDKTVPNPDYREHTGLLWVLNSLKIYNEKTDEPFDYSEDYFGFFPIDPQHYEIKEIPNVVEYPPLIYLADTYGVYEDDFFKENLLGTKSDIIYGGLIVDEVEIFKSNLGGGNTIIGEFNIAQEPTYGGAADALGEIFRMEWTNWCGRYFFDLTEGVEVPVWAVEYYETSTGLDWQFTGEGYVFVNDFQVVVVFEKGKHFGNDYVTMAFDEQYYDEFNIKGDIPYEYWFEFTEPDDSAEILARFTFDVTEEGQKMLDEIGLTSVFPAITRTKNSMYTAYYFAGDFADGITDFTGPWASYYNYSGIKRVLTMGELGDNKKFFWKVYVPMMEKIMDDILVKVALDNIEKYDEGLQYNVQTTNSTFQVKQGDEFENIFIKGVNIGSSTPGKWFTEFSNDEDMFLEWFEQIAGMNANTIRAYTLLSPQFYTAFVHYNETHPDKPLWLYQEIWPEENPEDNDYLRDGYVDEYLQEIEYVISAINGDAFIPYRKGRASGIYTSDVSPYLAGYMIGRELEAKEVKSTNELHPDFTYSGDYIFCSFDASPTEAWLAMCCDYAVKYETETYQWQHPVGIVSWPTLDVAEHDSEWNAAGDKSLEFNDSISIDINNLLVTDNLKTGLFGAYHIYPNYPDFMNNEKSYAEYEDEQGAFRYGGYLQEFISTHSKYPAIVAEFGLATGMSMAHSNPDGYFHGGMTEQEQGEGIVRMFEAIKREDYAGGIIFEWSDEWSKKTWNTESYIIPFDRNVMWHGMTDPEQNYGIIAMEAAIHKSQEYTVLGDIVNLAARFESDVAQPGQIILGQRTYEQICHKIECQSLGEYEIRGKVARTHVYQALRVLDDANIY